MVSLLLLPLHSSWIEYYWKNYYHNTIVERYVKRLLKEHHINKDTDYDWHRRGEPLQDVVRKLDHTREHQASESVQQRYAGDDGVVAVEQPMIPYRRRVRPQPVGEGEGHGDGAELEVPQPEAPRLVARVLVVGLEDLLEEDSAEAGHDRGGQHGHHADHVVGVGSEAAAGAAFRTNNSCC